MYFGYKLGMILIDKPIGMALGAVAYLLSIYLWFFIMSDILDSYSMSTCLEMMKNKECINLVLRDQKFERAKRTFRIYQKLKLIRRQMVLENRRFLDDQPISDKIK